MIAYPALDLRGGRTVQLVGGVPERERVSLPDPIAVARRWIELGFRALHVIDLEAALGHGDNRRLVHDVVQTAGVPVQVGGGIRDGATADELLDAGAARVILGTRAILDRAFLESLAARHAGRIVVAADVRDGEIVTHGWTERSGMTVTSLLESLDPLPLAGVLVTDVSREGRMTGVDADRFAGLAGASRHAVIAAGGIASLADLRTLATAGVAGAVLGMSLYTGAIDGAVAAREFAA